MNSYLPPAQLSAPFDKPTLAGALQRQDLYLLLQFTRQLRLAGYRLELNAFTRALLDQGSAWVEDSCGQPVQISLSGPAALALAEPPRWRLAA
jgi:hypothetical protein